MPLPDSRSEYETRMHRVVEYIDRNLDQPLDLDTLAGVAHFSPFHFHRLFLAWMGETLGDYMRRRRLELAARRLTSAPRQSVLEIALTVGFGSAEAFTRAFKARFGCSPTAWRAQHVRERAAYHDRGGANSNPDQADRKIGQATGRRSNDHGASSTQEVFMNVKLVERQPTTVAYLRHTGPYGDPISQFWMQKVYPWLVTNGLLDCPRYGISHDDPGITAAEQCRYDACSEVPANFVPNGGAQKTVIPGGKYAVLDFKGTNVQIFDAWSALLGDWLPSSGMQMDGRPCFEYYPKGSSYEPATGVFHCQICIPVVPL